MTEDERLVAHQKERDVLFSSETLVITVLQAVLTGGAMFAAIAGAQNLVEILGGATILDFSHNRGYRPASSRPRCMGKASVQKMGCESSEQ